MHSEGVAQEYMPKLCKGLFKKGFKYESFFDSLILKFIHKCH